MRERWLHTLWGRQDWHGVRLKTHSGLTVQVLHPGIWNNDQGPDFLQAQIFLEQVLWVGSIEIHVRSSDWYLHQHPQDPNYFPVILHVVWQLDLRHPDLPTLELSRYYSLPQLRESVLRMGDIASLPCHRILRPVPAWLWADWRDQLLNDRIARKRSDGHASGKIGLRRSLARQLGAWINRDVFESIDASIASTLFSEFRHDLNALTALLLGQAGLLNTHTRDPYATELASVYSIIRTRHSLNPPYRQLLWMRQRPAADPGFRLAQLAVLIHGDWDDPSNWQTDAQERLRQSFLQIVMHPYWSSYRSLDGVRVNRPRSFSPGVVEGLMVNIWAWMKDLNEDVKARWTHLSFEDNRVTRMFHYLDIQDPTAADSQALLELYHQLCQHRKCGSCALAVYWIQDQAPQST